MNHNLSSYYIFYMAAKSGNISAASKELFISQPAVSKSISKLEANLNVRLLIRNSRGVILTNEGKILYERLAEAFHSIELGEEQLKFECQSEIEHLTIGVSTTLCKYVLLPYLKEFVRKHPHIRISIACQPTYQTLQALEEGAIDIGLVGEPNEYSHFTFHKMNAIEDVFVSTQSYLDNLLIRTGMDYHDCSKAKELFKNATLMLLNKENLSRRYVDQFIQLNEIQAENLIEVSTMDLLIEFAAIGIGIACVIRNFVEKEIEDGTLVEIPMPFSIPKRNIGLIYKKNTYNNPALESFLKFYQDFK